MKHSTSTLSPGLYLVATPIGNARDITLRALDVLSSADVLAAEDTRTARKLLDLHQVPLGGRPLIAYHDHSGASTRDRLVSHIAEGKSLAYVSEAGTPLISDPGFALARAVSEAGCTVTTTPGACAAIAALTIAGLPTDRFLFAGFAPSTEQARAAFLAEISAVQSSVVLYESPKRVQGLLTQIVQTSPQRPVALCRELTKRFETVLRGTAEEVLQMVTEQPPRGECVIVLGRPCAVAADHADVRDALRQALTRMRMKDAATAVAGQFGLPRREVYQMALNMEDDP